MNQQAMHALKFSENDLVLNRSGILSDGQKSKIMRGSKMLATTTFALIFALGLGVFIVNDRSFKTGQVIAMVSVAGCLILFSLFFFVKNLNSIIKGKVKKTTGTIHFEMRSHTKHLVITETNQSFFWPFPSDLIKPGTNYNVYFLDPFNNFLSMEEEY
ncbi:MAG: hypothetical protein MJE63_24920 [Proteobacteria bacterium]|nr:hypothetical protein [Pseudomonadota bacterium]